MVTLSSARPEDGVRSGYAVRVYEPLQIAGHEWRWLVLVSSLLVVASLLPLFVSAAAVDPDWQFMGVVHNYLDGASYLAKMRIGLNGGWLLQFLHTPEAHDGALMMLLYPTLGHLARVTGLQLIVVFHLARVVSTFAMYISLYTLAAVLWHGLRARRLFFAMVAVGAGLGWLMAPLTGRIDFPDLTIPEIFPYFSSLMNPHFPLAIAALALLAAQFVLIIRPGEPLLPRRAWLVTAGLSLAVALLYPQGLVPFTGAVLVYLVNLRLRMGLLPRWAMVHMAALIAPAVPLAAYLAIIVQFNPAFAEWNAQNVTSSPPWWVLALGLGLPLLLGIPAMVRAARVLDRDGDRLMLWWLLIMLVAVFLPTNIQRRFSVGMMIPVAFFVVRALRGFWIPRLGERVSQLLVAGAIPIVAISMLLATVVPALPLLAGRPEERLGVTLPRFYSLALSGLATYVTTSDVVLAGPEPSAWVPGLAGARVVYGHPFETLDAQAREAAVRAWYALPAGPACRELLDSSDVRYVLFGPLEAVLGAGACLDDLTLIARYGTVAVYAVPEA